MHHPTDRITHATTFVTPVVEHWLEREIAQWVRLSEVLYQRLGCTSTFDPDKMIVGGVQPVATYSAV